MYFNKMKQILLSDHFFRTQGSVKTKFTLTPYSTGPISLEFIWELYERYKKDLINVRKYQRKHYKNNLGPGRSLYGDIECELTYLLLRETSPKTVVEISPYYGWSTSWILHGLRDNGLGHLYSFDQLFDFPGSKSSPLIELPCLSTLPENLTESRFTLTEGDVREQINMPDQIDYLFIDSEHTAEFAKWFIRELFPRITKGSVISVHDIEGNGYNDDFLADVRYRMKGGENGEDREVLNYLKSSDINFFHSAVFLNEIRSIRKSKGIKGTIRNNYESTSLFFQRP